MISEGRYQRTRIRNVVLLNVLYSLYRSQKGMCHVSYLNTIHNFFNAIHFGFFSLQYLAGLSYDFGRLISE